MYINNQNVYQPQTAGARDITKNPFLRYTTASLQLLMIQSATIIQTPGVQAQLLADESNALVLMNDALEVFQVAQLGGLSVKSSTTGVDLIEQITGKTWKDLNDPSIVTHGKEMFDSFVGATLSAVNKAASKLAESTKR